MTGFLFRPVETFQKSREDTLQSAFLYYLLLLVVYVMLSILVMSLVGISFLQIPEAAAFFRNFLILAAILLLVGGIVGPFITGILLQIGVLVAGGKKGYFQTVKASLYASTPFFLLGWIPVINFIALIWHLALNVIGIRELQEISTGSAVVAIVIAIAIIIVIAIILAAVLAAVIVGMAGAGTPV